MTVLQARRGVPPAPAGRPIQLYSEPELLIQGVGGYARAHGGLRDLESGGAAVINTDTVATEEGGASVVRPVGLCRGASGCAACGCVRMCVGFGPCHRSGPEVNRRGGG